MPVVSRVLASGTTKSSVVLESGLNCDLRVVALDEFGSALQYFTGSKEHNIKIRKIAVSKKLKLSEYGIFNRKTGKRIASKTEREVYAALGLPYFEPELREDTGEVEAALGVAGAGKLPKVIGYGDVRGDLHVHSNYSDGGFTIKEMSEAAKRLEREYIAVTDHSPGLGVAHGLKPAALKKHAAECARAEKEIEIRVLHGSEVNIRLDGTLDYPDKILEELDFVVASVHSAFNLPTEEQTQRVLRALDNEFVHALGHPTGRKLNKRDAYEIDLQLVFEKARDNKVLLEINSWPERLDLNDVNARQAVKTGATLVINTDAHSTQQLENMRLGIATARRGWAERKNVANALSFKDFERKWLEK
ncbi:PHP domain-containing protein [Candidatus Micrarchaeota archaeon]|nr:PHP domain-containing protein [Candidatus Micrarchaeota archaeon]